MNLILTINFLIVVIKTVLIGFYPIYSLLIWDISLMFHVISLSCVVGKLLPRSNVFGRIVNLSLLIVSFCLLAEYAIKCIAMYYGVFDSVKYITTLIYSCAVLPIIGSMFLPLSRVNDKYNIKNSFLVYKRGTSKLGMLVGQCCIVNKGIKYYYKKSRLIKKRFKYRNDCIYEKIDGINKYKLNKMLGSKWSIFNNCYNLKERIKKNV